LYLFYYGYSTAAIIHSYSGTLNFVPGSFLLKSTKYAQLNGRFIHTWFHLAHMRLNFAGSSEALEAQNQTGKHHFGNCFLSFFAAA
jgi:hypothetical protein